MVQFKQAHAAKSLFVLCVCVFLQLCFLANWPVGLTAVSPSIAKAECSLQYKQFLMLLNETFE